MATIPFTNSYVDLSSGRGFRFKFHCQKCGNGYVSTFQTNTLSTVATAAQVVANLLGGLLGQAAHSAQSLEQAVAGPQHGAALRKAVEEIAPTFQHAPPAASGCASRCAGTGERNCARLARRTSSRRSRL